MLSAMLHLNKTVIHFYIKLFPPILILQVRAHNRVGFGPWSDSLEVVSGAGAPDPPQAPRVSCRSPTSVHIEWDSPINNGAVIIEYAVEMALISSR
jgi:hypothetical protein